MPLNANILANTIKGNTKSAVNALKDNAKRDGIGGQEMSDAAINALAAAIIEHIITNLSINITIAPGAINVAGTAIAQSNALPVGPIGINVIVS